MKNQIIFRPIIKKDYLAIEKIIRAKHGTMMSFVLPK